MKSQMHVNCHDGVFIMELYDFCTYIAGVGRERGQVLLCPELEK
jgi:hypothetical protein